MLTRVSLRFACYGVNASNEAGLEESGKGFLENVDRTSWSRLESAMTSVC